MSTMRYLPKWVIVLAWLYAGLKCVATTVVDKEQICPVCGHHFLFTLVGSWFQSRSPGKDMDGSLFAACSREVVTCPRCLYSAQRSFEPLSDSEVASIKDLLAHLRQRIRPLPNGSIRNGKLKVSDDILKFRIAEACDALRSVDYERTARLSYGSYLVAKSKDDEGPVYNSAEALHAADAIHLASAKGTWSSDAAAFWHDLEWALRGNAKRSPAVPIVAQEPTEIERRQAAARLLARLAAMSADSAKKGPMEDLIALSAKPKLMDPSAIDSAHFANPFVEDLTRYALLGGPFPGFAQKAIAGNPDDFASNLREYLYIAIRLAAERRDLSIKPLLLRHPADSISMLIWLKAYFSTIGDTGDVKVLEDYAVGVPSFCRSTVDDIIRSIKIRMAFAEDK